MHDGDVQSGTGGEHPASATALELIDRIQRSETVVDEPLQRHIEQWSTTLEELRRSRSSLEEEVGRANEQIAQKGIELAAFQGKVEALRDMVAMLHSPDGATQIEQDFESFSADIEKRRAALTQEWEAANGSVGAIEAEVSALQESIGKARGSEVGKVSTSLASKASELELMQRRIQVLREDLRSCEVSLENLRRLHSSKNTEVERIQETLQLAEQSVKRCEIELQSLQGGRTTTLKSLTRVDEDMEAANVKLEEGRTREANIGVKTGLLKRASELMRQVQEFQELINRSMLPGFDSIGKMHREYRGGIEARCQAIRERLGEFLDQVDVEYGAVHAANASAEERITAQLGAMEKITASLAEPLGVIAESEPENDIGPNLRELERWLGNLEHILDLAQSQMPDKQRLENQADEMHDGFMETLKGMDPDAVRSLERANFGAAAGEAEETERQVKAVRAETEQAREEAQAARAENELLKDQLASAQKSHDDVKAQLERLQAESEGKDATIRELEGELQGFNQMGFDLLSNKDDEDPQQRSLEAATDGFFGSDDGGEAAEDKGMSVYEFVDVVLSALGGFEIDDEKMKLIQQSDTPEKKMQRALERAREFYLRAQDLGRTHTALDVQGEGSVADAAQDLMRELRELRQRMLVQDGGERDQEQTMMVTRGAPAGKTSGGEKLASGDQGAEGAPKGRGAGWWGRDRRRH